MVSLLNVSINAALAAMNAEKLNFQAEYSPVLGALGLYVASRSEWAATGWGGRDHDPKDHGPATKDGYEKLIARYLTPMTAKDLLGAIKGVVPDFSYHQATTFGQALRNEQSAIESKFQFKITEDKKDKVKLYSVAPSGGYPSWKAHQKAVAERKSAR